MKVSATQAILLLCGFVLLVFGVAFFYNPHFPVLVLAGENSVGTWISGTLLIFMAVISLVISMTQQRHPWFLATAFFLLLALDERFMFHEQLKEHIIFSFKSPQPSHWAYGLPVVAGAIAGGLVSITLWRHLSGMSRVLLLCAALLGTASVFMDITAGGVVWEEGFKLVGELLMVCALILRVER